MIRVEFDQAVSEECIYWLWNNVGPGNVQPEITGPLKIFPICEYDAWFYKREFIKNPGTFPVEGRYVPTITVKDPELAMLFALRWSG